MNTQIRRAITALLMSMFCILYVQAQKTIHGTVKDAAGESLIGVTVSVDGKAGAVTDIDGNFSIPNVSEKSTLKVSYIGYVPQTLTIGGKTEFNIIMQEDQSELQEVVVVGYGTMKKSDLTGSVSSVDTEKLNAKGATTLMENLQGATPGVNITQSSSRAGGGFDIEIRGKSTLGSNNTPLYVVDGVISDDINWLNPQDIERIDVLKDASSTAIYGSRATNGVVIVTTKSAKAQGGKATKPTISYDGYYGIVTTARTPDFMNGSQFAQYRHFRNLTTMVPDENGLPTLVSSPYAAQNFWGMSQGNYDFCYLTRENSSDSYVKEIIANGKETDWKDLVTRTGKQQNHFISVSGNSNNANYYFGAGYQNEESIYKGDSMDRFNIKGAVDSKLNDWLSAGISFNGAYSKNSTVDDVAISNALRLHPLIQAYDEDGNIAANPGRKEFMGTGSEFTSTANPLLDLENSYYETKTYQALANIYLELRPLKNLSLKTTFSPNYIKSRAGEFEGSETAARGYNVYTVPNPDNRASVENTEKFSWTWDNQINYNLKLNDHSFSVMGLFSASKFTQEKYTQEAYAVPEQVKWYNLSQAASETYTSASAYTEWSMLSYAARLNYSYKDRYLFTGTVRWDGSSRFADGNRWGSFPSAAVAWRITEEPFMAKTRSWLSNLKLRVSFGVTGNNYTQGTNYPTTVSATGSDIYYGFADGTGKTPYYPSGIVNKDLTWEKTTEYNIGLDFGFLNNRITGSIDWYTKTSKDLLMSRQLTYEAGGLSVIDNIGKVRNKGIEVSLTTVNIDTKDWNWTTSFNFAHNKNEILEVNGGKEDDIANSWFIGESINALYNYIWDGIVSDKPMIVPDTKIAVEKGFTPGESVISRDYYYACYGWGEGMPIIKDIDGNGSFDQTDKVIIGKSDPSWTGSISSTLQYKNWDFSFSIYTKQNYKVYSPFYKQYTNYGDRGMSHINMDFYIPAGTLLSCDYDEYGNMINPVYQESTHYGSYPFPTYNTDSNSGAGTIWAGSSAKDGADSMSDMKSANSKGAPYQVVDGSYWKVKNISIGYTFPQKILAKTPIKSLRLYLNVTNPFVWAKDYKGFDPEWCGAKLADGGFSTVTWQLGGSIKF